MTEATMMADRRGRLPSRAGEEELRFIRNFHDIFLSIGLTLFIAGLGMVSGLVLGENLNVDDFADLKRSGLLVAGVAFADAAILWLMAEFFARSRRLFLPAITIMLGFVFFVSVGAFFAYAAIFGDQSIDSMDDAVERLKLLPVTVSLAGAAATFVYYLRMKLPFAMGFGALMLVYAGVWALVAIDAEGVMRFGNFIMLAGGLVLFVLGVMFDARDPKRATRYSDNGFWLHFFAAPLIFGGAVNLATGGGMIGGMTRRFQEGAIIGEGAGASSFDPTVAAAVTLVIVIIFAIISLLINRRALLVAGLISAAISVGILVNATGLSGAWTGGVTLLLLGGAMVLLGGGWHWVRRKLVSGLPKEGLIARIIPPEPDLDDAEGLAAAEEGAR